LFPKITQAFARPADAFDKTGLLKIWQKVEHLPAIVVFKVLGWFNHAFYAIAIAKKKASNKCIGP